MSASLADDLARVFGLVSYLVVPLDPVGEEWISAERLVSDPAFLRTHIDATAPGRGTDDPAVAASMFVQSYAYRLAAATLAPLVLNGRVPAATPDRVVLRVARHRPAGIGLLTPIAHVAFSEPASFEWLAETLFAAHFDRLVNAVRETIKVGERLLWGNIASSCVSILRTIEGALPGREEKLRIRTFTTAFLQAMPHEFASLGSFLTLNVGDAEGWYHERTTCCLWYKTDEAQRASVSYCADCSLTPTDERRTTLLLELTPKDT